MEYIASAQIAIRLNGASEKLTQPSRMEHAVVRLDIFRLTESVLHHLELMIMDNLFQLFLAIFLINYSKMRMKIFDIKSI
jgi:hypothetical protein